MAEFEGYSEDDMARLQEYIKLREKARTSLLDYKEITEELAKLKANERFYQKELARYEKKAIEYKINRTELEVKLSDALLKNDVKSIKLLEKELNLLEEKESILNRNTHTAEQEIKHTKALGSVLVENLNTNNLMGAAYGSTLKTLKFIGKELYNQKDYLLKQQKGVKATELQMGLLSKESAGFRDNLYNASLSTNQLGIDTVALGKMQGSYSQEIGRTVTLTEAGNQAMAELASGTVLGTENAAKFAANMEMFGYSVEASRDFMQETLDKSHKMGLNSAATTEKLNRGLKLAQKYNFAEGVKGVAKMAMIATKMRLEMESVAGLAEQVFNPEGAVEMAAKLSVLGGAWSQLGDPFSLMFKARNDLAGLTEDIAKAAAGTAQFNKETGEFEIASMELHRLREVANATGISMDELTASARNAAKFTQIKSQVTANFDDDVMDFIAAKGRFDKDSGEFKIHINGKDKFISELNESNKIQLKSLVKENESLKERALQAQTFDDQWNNVINQFKATILPGFELFSKGVMDGLVKFSNWMQEDGVLKGIQTFGKQVGTIAGAMIKFASNNPWMTLIGVMVGKAASWAMRGRIMGLAFNRVASVSGGSAGGAGATGATPGKWSKGSNLAKGLGRGGAVGLAGGLAMNMGRGLMDDPDSDVGKGMGVAGSALSGAGTGMLLGSALGPIGSIVGGILGGAIGAYSGYQSEYGATNAGEISGGEAQDFIARPGQSPMKFSSADTLIGMKKGGGIDNFINKQEKSSSTSGNVNVNFNQPLKVEGKLTLLSGGQSSTIDLNNPVLIRELSRLVQEELTISLNGKRNPNPMS